MLKRIKSLVVFSLVALLISACGTLITPPTKSPDKSAGLANPASTNCTDKGGTLSIEKDGSGNEYGVCHFEDNLQCEEWAMMKGECPEGGLKVIGYVTTAATYCAITGGDYAITGNSGNTENEQGTCTFKSGKSCDVWDYYNGKCTK